MLTSQADWAADWASTADWALPRRTGTSTWRADVSLLLTGFKRDTWRNLDG